MIRSAMALARRGIPVFPLHTPIGDGCSCGKDCEKQAGKHPRTRNGLRDASIDPGAVRAWWERWPSANIGLATGLAARVWVLDIDNDTPAGPWLYEMQQGNGDLPRTRFCRTGSGGRHWYFRLDGDVTAWLDANGLDLPSRNGANGMKGRDVKAAGGYVIAPPSLHRSGERYEWLDERSCEYAPEWVLFEVARPREVRPPSRPQPRPAADDSHDRKWGLAVLRKRCVVIAESQGDGRHDAIRAQSKVVGGVVGAGYVTRDEAENALVEAGLSCGRDMKEVRRTVRWGLDQGELRPIMRPTS